MKKLLLLLLILVIVGGSVFAFDILSYPPALDGGGSIMIDAGVGITSYGWAYNWYGKMSIPPIFVQVEYALPVGVPISVGGFTAFYQYKYDGYYWTWRNNYLTIGARANWHWGFDIDKLDFYTGLWFGYRAHWYTGDHDSSYSYTLSGFDYGAQVGVHFYFTPVFGAMVETGYPFLIKTGVALKFGGGGGSSGGRYVVNVDSLNVRSGPSADNALVGSLVRGTRVEVLDKSGTWWKIRSGNITGYVNSSYLKAD
jgi:uncharacterized protein YraI